jgi:hypothetical protein
MDSVSDSIPSIDYIKNIRREHGVDYNLMDLCKFICETINSTTLKMCEQPHLKITFLITKAFIAANFARGKFKDYIVEH